MKITRINADKDINQEVLILDIEISLPLFDGTNNSFRITEERGKLLIHKRSGYTIDINPCCANECKIS
jgi:hypothetical protein